MTYKQFRTGISFGQVAKELAWEARAEYAARGQYKPVTRRRILGRLRAYKQEMYTWAERHAGLSEEV